MADSSISVVAVLDTNVWISGIFFRRGLPALLLRAWLDDRFHVAATPAVLDELGEKLQRKAVQFAATAGLADEWMAYIRTYARLFPASGTVVGVCRDPKDDQFLDAAVSAAAPFLVTGDMDLLTLAQHRDVRIVTPRQFAEELRLPL